MERTSVMAMRSAKHGQIIVIFALMLTALVGMAGIAIDVAHARSVTEDLQRAADAAALAGVVYLSGTDTPAPDIQKAEASTQAAILARANGFADDGGRTTTITYTPDTQNRTLAVTITYKVQTSFLELLGYQYLSVTRTATATWDGGAQQCGDVATCAPAHLIGQ